MDIDNIKFTKDGSLAMLTPEQGKEAIRILKSKGFIYGQGELGWGLYSPNKDRSLGYWSFDHAIFYLNPSLILHLKGA